MFNNNTRKGLKAWVRYDGNNNAVAGSLIFQKDKPKVGKWKEYQDVSLCCPPTPCPTPDFGAWTLVTGGTGGDGTALVDGTDSFTLVGPDDSSDDGWIYVTRQFATETCLEVEYSYAAFDDLEHDYPVYWTSATEPTGVPGDTTNRAGSNPDNGTWTITVPAGEWVGIGLYSDDSCCGRGFLSIEINEVECTTVVEYQLANDNSAESSCASLPATETYYSDTNDIGIGTYLYYDSALTNPVDDGWYASPFSGFTYEVSTGDGMINNAAPCG